jgi:hypothetical protein
MAMSEYGGGEGGEGPPPDEDPRRLRLWKVTAPELASVTLKIRLQDEFGNPTTEQEGGRLRLVRRRRPRDPAVAAAGEEDAGNGGQPAPAPHEDVDEEVGTAVVERGAVALTWGALGLGDGWLGWHLLLVEPAEPDDELAAAHPIAILVEVVPANLPSALVPLSPWAAPADSAARGGTPPPADAAAAAAAAVAEAPVVALNAALRGGSQLPALLVGVTTRDGRPLRHAPRERLVALLLQLAPAGESGGGGWAEVPGYSRAVPVMRNFGAAAAAAVGGEGECGEGPASPGLPEQGRQDRRQRREQQARRAPGRAGSEAPVQPVYEFPPGALHVPSQPGVYKWVLRYPSEAPGGS